MWTQRTYSSSRSSTESASSKSWASTGSVVQVVMSRRSRRSSTSSWISAWMSSVRFSASVITALGNSSRMSNFSKSSSRWSSSFRASSGEISTGPWPSAVPASACASLVMTDPRRVGQLVVSTGRSVLPVASSASCGFVLRLAVPFDPPLPDPRSPWSVSRPPRSPSAPSLPFLFERTVAFVHGRLVPCEELLLVDATGVDVDEDALQLLPWLVTETAVTVLAEVFEGLVLAIPAVALLVVLSCSVAANGGATGDANDRLLVPALPGTPHTTPFDPCLLRPFAGIGSPVSADWPVPARRDVASARAPVTG